MFWCKFGCVIIICCYAIGYFPKSTPLSNVHSVCRVPFRIVFELHHFSFGLGWFRDRWKVEDYEGKWKIRRVSFSIQFKICAQTSTSGYSSHKVRRKPWGMPFTLIKTNLKWNTLLHHNEWRFRNHICTKYTNFAQFSPTYIFCSIYIFSIVLSNTKHSYRAVTFASHFLTLWNPLCRAMPTYTFSGLMAVMYILAVHPGM
jgi:hypothetical protein